MATVLSTAIAPNLGLCLLEIQRWGTTVALLHRDSSHFHSSDIHHYYTVLAMRSYYYFCAVLQNDVIKILLLLSTKSITQIEHYGLFLTESLSYDI